MIVEVPSLNFKAEIRKQEINILYIIKMIACLKLAKIPQKRVCGTENSFKFAKAEMTRVAHIKS